ncbi:hypothetical protein MNBD_ALPHA07-965 [hydrothermal vent metagenome]|uniref:Uncharacterized protein n=1 Tax=hydrothermal vent metagenome TaxID=652676 RepID=A0A3B0S8P7_9ZZZZ
MYAPPSSVDDLYCPLNMSRRSLWSLPNILWPGILQKCQPPPAPWRGLLRAAQFIENVGKFAMLRDAWLSVLPPPGRGLAFLQNTSLAMYSQRLWNFIPAPTVVFPASPARLKTTAR